MKLEYKILWIDDRPNHVKSAKEYIDTKLTRHGFKMELTEISEVSNTRNFGKRVKKGDYDLIVVDYKMQPNAPTGEQIIKQIRIHRGATIIIFYSSDTPQELRKKIDVDGVYCTNRNDLSSKVWELVQSNIKKALDLNQMRGLHLASVANFDALADDLICAANEVLKTKGGEENYTERLLAIVDSFHASRKQHVETIDRQTDLSECLELLSSDKKVELLRDMLTNIDDIDLTAHISHLNSYTEEMLTPRNKLAHYYVKEERNGRYVLSSRGKAEVEFTESDFTSLRHKAHDYSDTFAELCEKLRGTS